MDLQFTWPARLIGEACGCDSNDGIPMMTMPCGASERTMLPEEFFFVARADVLEHVERVNSVELAGNGACNAGHGRSR